jgi:hypothetical protein
VGLSINVPLPESLLPLMEDSALLPGYHEPDEEETTMSDVLDSYLPFIHDKDSSIKLPIYLGKSSITSPQEDGGASTSLSHTVRAGKDFAWSRGLGLEISPIKTRSTEEKCIQF